MAPTARAKRIYEVPADDDGYRVLVDHIWPRGVSRERAALNEWAPDLAPNDDLRKWFDHVPARYAKFRVRYRRQLRGQAKRLDQLRRQAINGRLTILYAARDEEHNNAVVVAELLNARAKRGR
jgi:uncharacterized protein YeaO (DUF488 family)